MLQPSGVTYRESANLTELHREDWAVRDLNIMEKTNILNIIKGYKFLAIDTKQQRIVVAMHDVENGFEGFTLSLDNRGYSLSPMFIASTFISNTEDRYIFTNNLDEAFGFCDRWIHL